MDFFYLVFEGIKEVSDCESLGVTQTRECAILEGEKEHFYMSDPIECKPLAGGGEREGVCFSLGLGSNFNFSKVFWYVHRWV